MATLAAMQPCLAHWSPLPKKTFRSRGPPEQARFVNRRGGGTRMRAALLGIQPRLLGDRPRLLGQQPPLACLQPPMLGVLSLSALHPSVLGTLPSTSGLHPSQFSVSSCRNQLHRGCNWPGRGCNRQHGEHGVTKTLVVSDASSMVQYREGRGGAWEARKAAVAAVGRGVRVAAVGQGSARAKGRAVEPEVVETRQAASSPNPQSLLFHIKGGGQLRATIDSLDRTQYRIHLEADLSDSLVSDDAPWMVHWGLSRSSREDWLLVNHDTAPPGTQSAGGIMNALRTPMSQVSGSRQQVELQLDAHLAPFLLNVVLYRPGEGGAGEIWLGATNGANFCIPVGLQKGRPDPLGASWNPDGSVNFALHSRAAEGVVLCLYAEDAKDPTMEVDFDPGLNKTGHIWHCHLDSTAGFTRYGYRCKGEMTWEAGNRFHSRHVLLDPYARIVAYHVPGQESLPSPALALGRLEPEPSFDWGEDFAPGIPLEELVVYRLQVSGFTADESSGVEKELRGTFEGVAARVDHLVGLGVNAVLLSPVATFDETLGSYYPVSFFSPSAAYGIRRDGFAASHGLRRMVKTLHEYGIEVLIEVVYSHTAEGSDRTPKLVSFRGIDNSTYYLCDEFGKLRAPDYGADNAFNCNHPTVVSMILDSLRHWVSEYHVDGFSFVNSHALVTGPHGQQLSRPLLVEAVAFDPMLRGVKLIADMQSPITGAVQSAIFPHWGRWAESNTSFKSDIRRFIRGEGGQLSSFATRFCGSGDLFTSSRGPCFSFNFVAGPFGYTLADSVSYSGLPDDPKTQAENGSNCGEEGPSENDGVMMLRVKQVRNLLLALMAAQGIPVLTMGDEYGHSKEGQTVIEDRASSFRWDALDEYFGKQLQSYIAGLVAFRKSHGVQLQRHDFPKHHELLWHGAWPHSPEWNNPSSCFLAASLHVFSPSELQGAPEDEAASPPSSPSASASPSSPLDLAALADLPGDIYVAFNAHGSIASVTLPPAPNGMVWHRVLDTSFPFEDDFSSDPTPLEGTSDESAHGSYDLNPYSSLLLEAMYPMGPDGVRAPRKLAEELPLATTTSTFQE